MLRPARGARSPRPGTNGRCAMSCRHAGTATWRCGGTVWQFCGSVGRKGEESKRGKMEYTLHQTLGAPTRKQRSESVLLFSLPWFLTAFDKSTKRLGTT